MKLTTTTPAATTSAEQDRLSLPNAPEDPSSAPGQLDPRLLALTRDRFSTGTHETVSQSRLVLMCFERIARDLRQAQESMTAGRHFDAHTNLIHAQDIVTVLRDALDADAFDGGPGLQAVYDWSISQLTLANARKDHVVVEQVASSLAEIGAAFQEASRLSRPAVLPGAGDPDTGTSTSSLSVQA